MYMYSTNEQVRKVPSLKKNIPGLLKMSRYFLAVYVYLEGAWKNHLNPPFFSTSCIIWLGYSLLWLSTAFPKLLEIKLPERNLLASRQKRACVK